MHHFRIQERGVCIVGNFTAEAWMGKADDRDGSKFLLDLGKFFFVFETYKRTENCVVAFNSVIM